MGPYELYNAKSPMDMYKFDHELIRQNHLENSARKTRVYV